MRVIKRMAKRKLERAKELIREGNHEVMDSIFFEVHSCITILVAK